MGEDLELDNAREACEAELLAFESEAGRKQSGRVCTRTRRSRWRCAATPRLGKGPPALARRGAGGRSRLMAIDGGFCEAHLALIFTRLRDESDRHAAPRRWSRWRPGVPVPTAAAWTEHLYGVREWGNSLHDPDSGVRQHAITVLAHLVLNDMMKVKGHIAEMARCLEDPDPRVAAVAKLLFAELSRKHGNPIYNLLPDLLSRSGIAMHLFEAFRAIMTRLLGFIDKDSRPRRWRTSSCTASRRRRWRPRPSPRATSRPGPPGLRRPELYEPALYDREVFAHLDAVVAKAKKTYGGKKAFAKSACETDAAGDVSRRWRGRGRRSRTSSAEWPPRTSSGSSRTARRGAPRGTRTKTRRPPTPGRGRTSPGRSVPSASRASGRRRRGGPRRGRRREAASAAAAADDDALGRHKLRRRRRRAEAEVENDETAPGENAPDAGAPEENARRRPRPSPRSGARPQARGEEGRRLRRRRRRRRRGGARSIVASRAPRQVSARATPTVEGMPENVYRCVMVL